MAPSSLLIPKTSNSSIDKKTKTLALAVTLTLTLALCGMVLLKSPPHRLRLQSQHISSHWSQVTSCLREGDRERNREKRRETKKEQTNT